MLSSYCPRSLPLCLVCALLLMEVFQLRDLLWVVVYAMKSNGGFLVWILTA